MTENKLAQVGVLMSFNMSLAEWDRRGILDREIAIYQKLVSTGEFRVTFLVYSTDLEGERTLLRKYDPTLASMDVAIIGKPSKTLLQITKNLFIYNISNEYDMLKSNQIDAFIPFLFRRLPAIVYARSGYTRSVFASRQRKFFQALVFKTIELIVSWRCDLFVVSSNEDKRRLEKRKFFSRTKLRVVPNYVDTDRFKPSSARSFERELRILFVGRLHKQKNLEALILACSKNGVGVDVFGEGPEADSLNALVSLNGLDVNFFPFVPSTEVMTLFSKYRVFALCSHYEGMPKILLEALAAGLHIVGTPVSGIREVFERDGAIGVMSETTSVCDIALAIRKLIDSTDLTQTNISGVNLVNQQFSLNAVHKQEKNWFKQLLQ